MKTPADKNRRSLIAVILVIVLVGLAYAVWTHFHHGHAGAHDHGDHGAAALSLDDGQRWATDEPLRIGMQRIRNAVAGTLATAEPDGLSPAQARALADTVQENVTYLIQNCRLEPKADATLHVLINQLLTGVAAATENPASDDGMAKLAEALREYPQYFDHPGWKPLPGAQP
ncbi:MAG: hypothetical protein H3C27_13280 [Opitutaceae bacterium]|nr:hypothetical protein [Opitutaceae bacterium]